jgi:phosphatidylserine/phosphatidylglycerophosphate/cardiolipin synthase-like enzyme
MRLSSLFVEGVDLLLFGEANVQTNAEQTELHWWAEGDTPVRTDSQVTFLVDGRHAMWTMCLHFLKARESIYLANWGITPQMLMVRGTDQRAGPDGSPEQERLVEELHMAGLAQDEIQFWCNQQLTLQNVLEHAIQKGVDVKVLLWACPEVFSHYSPKTAHEQLTQVGVQCLMDDSASRLPHPSESLHQKISIVDSQYAFAGGIDPLIELNGDFDRWDTPWHNLVSRLRSNHTNVSPHAWHDMHALIEGTAARDVEFNFFQRWNEMANRKRLPETELVPEPERTPQPTLSHRLVQIARTIPANTYEFAPKEGIESIAQIYAHALGNVRRFLYVENQYFWLHAFIGLNIGELGPVNHEMERNMHLLARALEQGASLLLILPDHPNVGRSFSDVGLSELRKNAPEATAAGRIQVFCLAHSTVQNGHVHYRPVYVHSKVAIIDDLWSTIGSANLNNRGMRDDAELNVAVLHHDFARDLRILLWAEHLGLVDEDEHFIVSRYLSHQPQHADKTQQALTIWQNLARTLGDPAAGFHLISESARANLQRFQRGESLVGHLFPYLTPPEAARLGLKFHESHGLFETPENEG